MKFVENYPNTIHRTNHNVSENCSTKMKYAIQINKPLDIANDTWKQFLVEFSSKI